MATQNTAFLRWKAIHELTALSKTTIDRLERDGRFPKRVKISYAAVGWPKAEVEAWLAGTFETKAPAQDEGVLSALSVVREAVEAGRFGPARKAEALAFLENLEGGLRV